MTEQEVSDRGSTPPADVASLLALLNDELGWGLTAAAQRQYCKAIAEVLPQRSAASYVCRVLINYHADHVLVHALRHSTHDQHDAAWRAWMPQALAILRHAGLTWIDDGAYDLDDLAQIALAELMRALPSYHYASRFSTWAHQVIVQSVRRYRRDLGALKRAGRPESLEALPELDIPVAPAEHPEAVADARVLLGIIDARLAAQPDRRLREIFRRWAVEDQRVEAIGRHVRLSASQVRVLIGHIRQMLRDDPAINTWLEPDDHAT
jgi:RNA polymerase sigma factor (sigma-70 family)